MAKRDNVTTKTVTLQYPKIQKPDTYGKYATGKYVTNFSFPAKEDEDAFKAVLRSKAKELMPKTSKPKMPWKTDDEGEVTFKASSKYKPLIVDSKNKNVPESARIGGGTKARLIVAFNSYEGRLSLYLNQVQIKELVEWESKAQQSQFDETDGYEADDEEATEREGDEESGFDEGEEDDPREDRRHEMDDEIPF